MNKFIKTDIENAVIQMKTAIMNALHDIDSGEETYIDLGDNISPNLLFHCLEESEWKEEEDSFDTNGWEVDFFSHWYSPSGKYVYITGCIRDGLNYAISVQ